MANHLTSYLEHAELTQQQFAELIGVSQGSLSKLCTGRNSPDLETAQKIERATCGAVPLSGWPKFAAVLAAVSAAPFKDGNASQTSQGNETGTSIKRTSKGRKGQKQ